MLDDQALASAVLKQDSQVGLDFAATRNRDSSEKESIFIIARICGSWEGAGYGKSND